ncbi:unnamed protein product [Urochloa humidicola]
MPFGEMAVTLQDVSMLTGLPIHGTAIGPLTTPEGWREDLAQKFQGVLPENVDIGISASKKHGPQLQWLHMFRLDRMVEDPYRIARHFEAYLLWLFGWVMFTSSHGDTVDARWIPIARAIADSPIQEISQLSWGSAVLCWTYRGLCQACIRKKSNSNLTGMPLLLNLWSYECFQVGRPYIQPEEYTGEMYGADMVDRPTMGSHWTRRRPQWAGVQVRSTYEAFTEQFDHLRPEHVTWEPYTQLAIHRRSGGLGISDSCYVDSAYWMTRKKLMFDVFVEDYAVHRVMRQFGLRQLVPVPVGDLVPRDVHEYKMQGPRKAMQELMRRMQPWMDAWEQATQDRVYEQAPYDPTSYHVYLQWYVQRTRTRLVSIRQRPEEATVPHALLYPGHAGRALHEAADLGMEME